MARPAREFWNDASLTTTAAALASGVELALLPSALLLPSASVLPSAGSTAARAPVPILEAT